MDKQLLQGFTRERQGFSDAQVAKWLRVAATIWYVQGKGSLVLILSNLKGNKPCIALKPHQPRLAQRHPIQFHKPFNACFKVRPLEVS